MSTRVLKLIKFSIIVLLFSTFLLYFLHFKLWDYDFWWHVATGKYIVTEGHLPEKDPFSFTSAMDENKNPFPKWEDFMRKQNWLADSFFYLVFDFFGPKGMICLRSILLILTLLVVNRYLLKAGVSLFWALIASFLLFYKLTQYIGERPVLFSILFTALVFSLVANFKNSRSKKILFLIPIMILWSNLHGGFVIGDIMVLIFIFGEGLKTIVGKSDYTKREKFLFFGTAIGAIVFSFINPTGWDAFPIALSHKYDILKVSIQEWQSPLYFIKEKIYPLDYGYLISVLMLPVLVIIRRRKLDLNYVLLLSGFLYESLRSARLVIFYMILAIMVMGRELDLSLKGFIIKKWSSKAFRRIEYGLAAAAFCSILLFMFTKLGNGKIEWDVSKFSVPVAAVDFIERNKIEGNMFNSFANGGYIAWRLYPWKKNFIDSRSLNIKVMSEMDIILGAKDFDNTDSQERKDPLWEKLLDHYRIEFLFISPVDYYGQIFPLIFKLTESDKWTPVFSDPTSVIFVRNTGRDADLIKKYKLSKDYVYNDIIYKCSLFAVANKTNPRYLVSLGEAFYKIGKLEDALKAYKYAYKRWQTPETRKKIDELESEVKRMAVLDK
jgi:hypothetical protein